MTKIIRILLTGFVGAIIVHIVQTFMMPHVAVNNAWARLAAKSITSGFSLINAKSELGKTMLVNDPNFVTGACMFSLNDGPIVIEGPEAPSFWSLSIYNSKGENIYSLNDRLTGTGKLNILIANPVQIIELQNETADGVLDVTVAEADIDEGFVLLRALLETDSMVEQAEKFVVNSICQPISDS